MSVPFNEGAAKRAEMSRPELLAEVNARYLEAATRSPPRNEGERLYLIQQLVLLVLHERYVEECRVDAAVADDTTSKPELR